MSDSKYPKPWKIERAGEFDMIVIDANGTKLFYISGDEGDGDEAKPSALFWSDDGDADTEYLLGEINEGIEFINSRTET